AHMTLDLLCDVPRRSFPVEPLERAWEIGLPGAYDAAHDVRGRGGASNLLAVALGSDGARAWFVVADSMGPRGRLDGEARQKLLFVAGECASVLLHRDLDEGGQATGPWNAGAKRFAGWSILEDLEGRDASADEVATIEQRFLIGRIVRDLVDEDFTVDGTELAERLRASREEIAIRSRKGGEPASDWGPVLDALEGE